MVLAKSDLAIASRYAELVADVGLRDAIFARFKAEWHGRRRGWVCGRDSTPNRSDQAKSQGLFDHLAVSRQLELEHGTFRYVR
jgi:hypothetical protein